MSLRAADVFVVVTVALAAAAVIRWVAGTSRPEPHGRSGRIVVENYTPDWFDVEPATGEEVACVRFGLAEDERLLGVAGAKVYPVLEERIAVERWDDVATAHDDGGLDLSRWMERRNPSGPYALLLSLCVEGPQGREYRIGWVRFEASRLRFSSLLVRPGARRRCRLEVVTASGQPVPGALVGLHPPEHKDGLATAVALSGRDGTCLVSGLGRDTWLAGLIKGVGPDKTTSSVEIGPESVSASLTSRLGGQWAFVESTVYVPYSGGSLLVSEVRGEDAPARAWPVSPFVPPGTGRRRSWTWMVPKSGSRHPPVVVTLQGLTPLKLADPSRPFVLEPSPSGYALKQPD